MTDKEKIGGINNALQQDLAMQEGQNLSNFERNGKKWKEDFEAEWKKYFENRGEMATVNVKHLAKHFFELGVQQSKNYNNIVYVITRCEEQSDYVEKVFFDERKAREYCNRFEGNENEYARDITKVEVE